MPNYIPPPPPLKGDDLPAYVNRELNRVGKNLADNAESIFYRTLPYTDDSLTAGASANYKIAQGNVIRISTSATITLTGIAVKQYNREIVVLNIGTGVLSFKSQGTESSASHRFALGMNYQISAGYALTLWYDLTSSRWRALSRS
jgi:hypothetical protein